MNLQKKSIKSIAKEQNNAERFGSLVSNQTEVS